MATLESRTLHLTEHWAKKNYRPGARCAECKTKFKRRSPAAGIVCLRNSAGGNSWYALCANCERAYNREDRAGIPNCDADAGVAILKSASVTRCAGRCKMAFTPNNLAAAIATTPKGDFLLCDSCYERWKTATMPGLSFTLLTHAPKKDTE